ncbi:TPA: CDP-glycerol glycerophosphotransferase family protein [Staphylococcus aureus]|uniref:CDP-glycerol glycerophosphotransferase family protein n=1 Tax=Staphylococcus aureus TaxID=1280 RepID=A0AAW4YAX0_STAAU|nr:teichoic acid glycerol-phosphate transferase TarF [Staphylococcus aureus]ALH98330.1 CDP-glycerol--glycerophosphate glycerophosphotransferase [Staphylococcus aureus]EHM60203.1 CDP-glycerol:poly(glycerophosphate) glycerophosphotransferase [Staphylococcus aureus subsp. aureus 21202]MBE7573101.1 CDP-glycerol glycerophosphotransferase family protein [Staphylococcus aureus]MBE7575008.1 CDP-glycerol glycerophosphotransferase family protein [Staphylococcus aureus]MBE7577828.1 CDP-glycerol glyceroph
MKVNHSINNFKHKVINNIFKLGSFFTNENLVYFESFHGTQYSDNPKAIYEYLKKHSNKKLIWGVKKGYESIFEENNVPYVRRFSIKWFLVMPRAGFWLINTRIPRWFYKSDKTIYLQTWHGTPLKKLGLDIENVQMPGTQTDLYRVNIVNESKRWDYLISPNDYATNIFERAFKVNRSKIIQTGYPRNDKLVNKKNDIEYIKKIKKSLKIPENKKVIMYTPTWRDDKFLRKGTYELELQFDIEKLRENFSFEYVILLRMHYLVISRVNEKDDFIIDVSDYKDISDLYLISDVLITDYSSTMFDFAILKKPQIFYAFDLKDYSDRLRGFYMKYGDNLPGPIVSNEQGLIKEIEKIHTLKDRYAHQINNFYNEYCSLEDGQSTKRVVEILMD